MESYPCAACGFLVFTGPPGSYNICPVCGWEDDHVQLRFPGSATGANHTTLFDYQREVALPTAPEGVNRLRGRRRAPGWRPLRPEEAVSDATEPRSGGAYFGAALEDAPTYYWERGEPRAI